VLSTGKTYPPPFRANVGDGERSTVHQLQAMAKRREELKAAQHILVVGGGATGIETAAEVISAFPDKHVVLMHAGSRLLDRQKEVSFHDSQKVMDKLIRLGVEVQLNTEFNAAGNDPSTAVVMCVGGTPNTSYLAMEALDEKGFIRVDGHLRLTGRDNVFAMGDIVSGYAPNLKTTVYLHAPVIVANVRCLLDGKPPNKVVGQLPSFIESFLVVTIGPRDSYAHGLVAAIYAPQKRKDFLMHRKAKELIA